ncbi:hypothetical protein V2J09_000576 [Rumex salicifolius]
MFLTIDVDELTELSTSWDIKATPTFFFLRDGQQIDKLVGANKPELQKKIIAYEKMKKHPTLVRERWASSAKYVINKFHKQNITF